VARSTVYAPAVLAQQAVDNAGELIRLNLQQAEKLDQMYTILVALIFTQLAFIGLMFAIAGWTMYTAGRRQTRLERRWNEVLQVVARSKKDA
jgi:hypothetical protein